MVDSIIISTIQPFFLHHEATQADANHDGVLTRREYESRLEADHVSEPEISVAWSRFEERLRSLSMTSTDDVYHGFLAFGMDAAAGLIARQVVTKGLTFAAKRNIILLALVTVGMAVYDHSRETEGIHLTRTDRVEDIGVRISCQLASEAVASVMILWGGNNPVGFLGAIATGRVVDRVVERVWDWVVD